MEARLAAVEDHLGSVSKLAAATAKQQGKERTGRLVVVFATGGFKERVLEILRQWDAGAAAFKKAEGGQDGEGGRVSAASSGAGEGLKYQSIYTFIFNLLLQPNLEGLAARAALQSTTARQAVQKKGSVWPECGIKPARFAPGKYHREVLQFQGYSEEEQMGYFKGKKSGKGGGRDGSNVVPGKRAASHRLSVSAPRDAKRR